MDDLHFCERCNRRLRSPKAIADGMGKVCKRKASEEKGRKIVNQVDGAQETSIKE